MRLLLILFLQLALVGYCLAGSSDSVKVYAEKAGGALINKNYQKAEYNYEQVLRLDSNNFEALKNMGVIYSTTGKNDKAKQYFEKAYHIDSENPSLCNNIGTIYSGQRDFRSAIKYFEKAVRLDSINTLYLTNLGREYLKVKEIEKAIKVLSRGIVLDPDKMDIRFTLARAFAAAGKLDSAEIYFDQCIKNKSKDPQVYYMAASVKRDIDKLEEAQSLYYKVIEISPLHKEAYQSIGLIYLRQYVFDSAAFYFEKTLGIDNNYYKAMIPLGAAYALNGDLIKADSTFILLNKVDSAMGFQMLSILKSIGEEMEEKSNK